MSNIFNISHWQQHTQLCDQNSNLRRNSHFTGNGANGPESSMSMNNSLLGSMGFNIRASSHEIM